MYSGRKTAGNSPQQVMISRFLLLDEHIVFRDEHTFFRDEHTFSHRKCDLQFLPQGLKFGNMNIIYYEPGGKGCFLAMAIAV